MQLLCRSRIDVPDLGRQSRPLEVELHDFRSLVGSTRFEHPQSNCGASASLCGILLDHRLYCLAALPAPHWQACFRPIPCFPGKLRRISSLFTEGKGATMTTGTDLLEIVSPANGNGHGEMAKTAPMAGIEENGTSRLAVPDMLKFINPASGNSFGELPMATPADVEQAMAEMRTAARDPARKDVATPCGGPAQIPGAADRLHGRDHRRDQPGLRQIAPGRHDRGLHHRSERPTSICNMPSVG